MPLLEHFHAPLHPERHWEASYSRWASAIADALNAELLPPDDFAEPDTHAVGRVEIGGATFEAPRRERKKIREFADFSFEHLKVAGVY